MVSIPLFQSSIEANTSNKRAEYLFNNGFISRESFYKIEEEFNLPPPQFSNTLIFGGDVMLSRYVDVQMWKHNNFKGPFEGIAERFRNADIAFINLESPFAQNARRFSLGMQFGANAKSISGLLDAGIDIVSLANNHFGDSGKSGMEFTFNLLKENNIYYTGAGRNIEEANNPTYITSNGITFAYFGFSDLTPYYEATLTTPGIMDIPESEELRSMIQRAKRLADVVIISVHTGPEYTKHPQEGFVQFSQNAIDSGASLIIGHHPHVVQPVEYYKDGIIFYSLGNLIFDQYFTGTQEGLVAEVIFENTRIADVSLLPIKIDNLWKARFATEEEQISVLERTEW